MPKIIKKRVPFWLLNIAATRTPTVVNTNVIKKYVVT